ncbi:MAG: uncharacterized protein A8A55_3094 [Amphiamblys sp. WSBS2006]|nr:MAG: uncharacterized protein A8A55_3094 [Amphiamblys sp. WSBS2006]
MFCEGSNNIWIGKVRSLTLKDYAVGILLKLRIHGENVMEELSLEACHSETLIEILKEENNSIWVGKVRKLKLIDYAVNILPKLRIHEENEMEELCLWTYYPGNITEILKKENNSIWIGKVKKLELGNHAVNILPKLRIHEENEMEELYLCLIGYGYYHTTEILKEEINSIWIGKVRKLKLKDYAVNILPKLRIHEENEMEELVLEAYYPRNIIEIIKKENNSIWIGKVRKINLRNYAVEVLPKLRIHEENLTEELSLSADGTEHLAKILEENSSIWIGRVKKLELRDYAVNILPKLRIHEENEMEELYLCLIGYCYYHIIEILKEENNSIWIGKVRKLTLKNYAVGILSRLKLHEENEMEELSLEECHSATLVEIFKIMDKSIWIGKVRKINLTGYAEKIKDKLDFTLLAPDDQEEIGSD